MNNNDYKTKRHNMVVETERLLSIHCRLCAKARIRKIAELDYEFKGTDREITKQSFNYYNLK